MVGFLAICRKDYTVLLACSSLVATCGIIIYFIIGLGYAFYVVMTVFVMEDHPEDVKICLLVNLGLEAARFFIRDWTFNPCLFHCNGFDHWYK